MSRWKRRIHACEHTFIRRLAAEAGAPYGVTADDLLEEARRFFALSLAEQLAELGTLTDEFSGEALDAMRTILIREYQPMA